MNKIKIIGAGGHTRSSLNLLRENFNNSILEIYDDSYSSTSKEHIDGIELVGKISDIKIEDVDENIFLSIGDSFKRKNYFNKFLDLVIKENLIHRYAYLEKNIKIGMANQIFANVYINSYVDIAHNNIINSGSILEHEVKIGSHNHISVGVKICGRVTIGDSCFIGAGAIVIDKVSICNNVIIGAGTVVLKDIKHSGTYVGNPARKIK